MLQQKACIFIDGQNFYNSIIDTYFNAGCCKQQIKIGDIQNGFDLSRFCKKLTQGQDLEKIYYFDARLNGNFKGEAIKRQNIFFNKLREDKLINVELGKIEGDRLRKYQKGVDVKMATYLIRGAHKGEYNLGYFISNDKDFCPAIEYIQNSYKNRIINYVFFKNRLTNMLYDLCRRSRKLKDTEVYPFCNLTLLKHLSHFTILSSQDWFKEKFPEYKNDNQKHSKKSHGIKAIISEIKIKTNTLHK